MSLFEQAVEDYRRALELDENYQRAKEGLATAQKRQKQVKNLIKHGRMVKKNPEKPSRMVNRKIKLSKIVKSGKTSINKIINSKSSNGCMYSQTCLQRPPLGPQKSGRCIEVVAL